jgi:predicted RNA binding protein YcfA (HicA-like mRNA interferase family)
VSKRIPPMPSKEFVKLLTRGGARFIRQKSTSMQYLNVKKKEGGYRTPVVMAKKELSTKYMKLVLRQLGFTNEEIDAIL